MPDQQSDENPSVPSPAAVGEEDSGEGSVKRAFTVVLNVPDVTGSMTVYRVSAETAYGAMLVAVAKALANGGELPQFADVVKWVSTNVCDCVVFHGRLPAVTPEKPGEQLKVASITIQDLESKLAKAKAAMKYWEEWDRVEKA